MSSPTEVIESVVFGSQSVLSFRQLSSLLQVPLHTAQTYLASYASGKGDDSLAVLWHVKTGSIANEIRTTLTTNPPSDARAKHVWAIGPSGIPVNPTVWLQPDREATRKQADEPAHQPNALRDGRFLPIASPTAAWDMRPDPRYTDAVPSSGGKSAPRKPGTLLSAIKQASKRSTQIAFKQSPSQTPLKASLFSSRRLGQDASDRMKTKERQLSNSNADARKKPSSVSVHNSQESDSHRNGGALQKDGKKKRRIVSEDDDNDDVDTSEATIQSKVASMDGESDDDDDSIQAIEHKAMEKERSEEEQAEIDRELRDLTNEDDGPESPKIKDFDGEEVLKQEVGTDEGEYRLDGSAKDGVKRSFRESFGLPEQPRGARRIRKEVSVTEEENGYIVTRKVMKTFDEHGNEINSDESERIDKDEEPGQHASMSCLPTMSSRPSKQIGSLFKSSSNSSQGKDKPSSAATKVGSKDSNKEKKKNGKSSTAAKSGTSASKKAKKGKGNIMSYFGKKM